MQVRGEHTTGIFHIQHHSEGFGTGAGTHVRHGVAGTGTDRRRADLGRLVLHEEKSVRKTRQVAERHSRTGGKRDPGRGIARGLRGDARLFKQCDQVVAGCFFGIDPEGQRCGFPERKQKRFHPVIGVKVKKL